MSLHYLPSVNQYLGKYSVFTPNELSTIDSLEKDWLSTQKNYSFYELINIFPEITTNKGYKKQLKDQIKLARQTLNKIQQLETDYQNKTAHNDPDQREIKRLMCETFVLEPIREEKNKLIKENRIKLSILNHSPQQSLTSSKITALDVIKAKQYPITSFLEFNQSGFAKCIYHNEKSPSFYYYKKTNTTYCFSCNTSGDTINVVQQLYSLNFKEAVKFILK